MVIPTGEVQAIGMGAKATAAMPIPSSSSSSNNFSKLSSSAPGDKLDYELLIQSQLSSSSQGISSYLTEEHFEGKKEEEEEPTKKEEEEEEVKIKQVASSPPQKPGPLTMDLEPSDRIMETNSGKYRRKFTDSELPPHLSEYSELNVISIVNQCDPERGRRCYSCGYDNTEKWLLQNNYYYRQLQQQKSQQQNNEPYSWTLQDQYVNQRTQPQICWNSNYFQTDFVQSNMSGQRKRVYSDGSSDLEGGNNNAMDDEEVFTFDARLLSEAFLSSGRVDHTIQLMAYHPDYLDIFLKTHHFLMRGDGPLPYNHRNYIAIMAAARYQCSYLMEMQKREFLYQGGDPKWLRGLDSAPAKLMALYNINKIMAHRPWVLKKEDFLHLTKKAGWSLSEVVQAVVILAHFHALSSFIHGCGISPEIDFDKGHTYMDPGNFNSIRSVSEALQRSAEMAEEKETSPLQSPSVSFAMDQPAESTCYFGSRIIPSNTDRLGKQTKSILKKTDSSNTNINSATNLLKDANSYQANSPPKMKGLGCSVSEVEIIMATMKNLSETSPIEDPEERKKRFENVASADDQEKENRLLNQTLLSSLLNSPSPSSETSQQNSSNIIPPEISPFVFDPDFIYEDFAKRGQVSELHTFRIQDYSWEEHGFSLVNRLYTEVGVFLDEKFKVTQGMTYYTMGGRAQVDTTKFRISVWNYIHCLFGIRHDDYDYGEVNQLLERPLKAYIKTVCCYPERITKADYDNVMREFKHSEKVHVNLMIMEAKIQAELLYALRTIMRFLI